MKKYGKLAVLVLASLVTQMAGAEDSKVTQMAGAEDSKVLTGSASATSAFAGIAAGSVVAGLARIRVTNRTTQLNTQMRGAGVALALSSARFFLTDEPGQRNADSHIGVVGLDLATFGAASLFETVNFDDIMKNRIRTPMIKGRINGAYVAGSALLAAGGAIMVNSYSSTPNVAAQAVSSTTTKLIRGVVGGTYGLVGQNAFEAQ